MRLHSKVEVGKQLRAKDTRLSRNVEKVTASFTSMANVRDGAAERADNLCAQLVASVRLKDVYNLELAQVKEGLIETRVERANLRWSVNDLFWKVRETSADLGGALPAVVQNSNRSFEDVAQGQSRNGLDVEMDVFFARHGVGRCLGENTCECSTR